MGVALVGGAAVLGYVFAKLSQRPTSLAPVAPDEARRIGLDRAKYNVAICGKAGSGKSTIINLLIKHSDYSSVRATPATTDIVECTMAVTQYDMTPTCVLWDLPGAGTDRHPASTYVADKCIKAFDAIILVTDHRWAEVDQEVYAAMTRSNKMVFVVRNKIDEAFFAEYRVLAAHERKALQPGEVVDLIRSRVRAKVTGDLVTRGRVAGEALYLFSALALDADPADTVAHPYRGLGFVPFDEERLVQEATDWIFHARNKV